MDLIFSIPSLIAQAGPAGDSGMGSLIMIGGVFVVMWFLVLNPQRKEAKKKKEMQSALKPGDRVITTSGMHAAVSQVDVEKQLVTLKIGDNNKVVFDLNSVSQIKTNDN